MYKSPLPPAVKATTHAGHLTQRYVQVNTQAVVDAMESAGFVVASARTANPRKNLAIHAKHSIDFRLPDAQPIAGAVPRVLFVNSHDGSSAVRAMAGLYRFVCENGLVIGNTVAEIRARHAGELAQQLIERMQALAKTAEQSFSSVERWSKIDLSKSQRHDYARLAAQLRWGDASRFEPEDLLQVRRADDDKGDLWTVFNRVQESTVRGGISGLTVSGRTTVARPISDITRDHDFNAMLWRITSEFAEHVA